MYKHAVIVAAAALIGVTGSSCGSPVVPIHIVSSLAQRYIVKGLTLGAAK